MRHWITIPEPGPRLDRPSPELPANSRAILLNLRSHPCSIADLEHLTRLSQLTIRRHVEALEGYGLITPAGLGRSSGGRHPRLFTLVSESRLALAMHLRFPGASVATVGLDGKIAGARHLPAECGEDPVALLERLARTAESLMEGAPTGRLMGIGVALPGYADLARGISLRIGRAPAWQDVSLGDILSRRLRLPTLLVHDSAAMALAEHETGEARGERHFAFVLAEEGVSAGLFLDGTVHQGAFGNAGLIGHMTVRPNGRPCYCGCLGCVESYASARALVERPAEFAPGQVPGTVTPAQVIRQALEGLEPYRTVLDEALESIGIAIANLAKILEIRTVFAGGYLSSLPDSARTRIFDVAQAHLQPPLKVSFEIRYSQILEAGLVGAAIPVIRRFFGIPGTVQ